MTGPRAIILCHNSYGPDEYWTLAIELTKGFCELNQTYYHGNDHAKRTNHFTSLKDAQAALQELNVMWDITPHCNYFDPKDDQGT